MKPKKSQGLTIYKSTYLERYTLQPRKTPGPGQYMP
jgi:hypothetical protein